MPLRMTSTSLKKITFNDVLIKFMGITKPSDVSMLIIHHQLNRVNPIKLRFLEKKVSFFKATAEFSTIKLSKRNSNCDMEI